MTPEDLVWKVPSPGSAPYKELKGFFSDDTWLDECEIIDVRSFGVLESVGVLIDMRTGFPNPKVEGWDESNLAVMVVRDVTECQVYGIRDRIDLWRVTTTADTWTLQVRMFSSYRRPPLTISGSGASMYVGRVPDKDEAQPNLVVLDKDQIRSQWFSWDSQFQLMLEPEHINLPKPTNML